MFSRRDFGKMAFLPVSTMLAKKIDSAVDGVQFGLQSYIFSGIGLPHDGILDLAIKSMVECGLGECDLYAPLVEPAPLWERIRAGAPARPGDQVSAQAAAAKAQAREELAKWRMTVSLDHFRAIRNKFDAAGIAIYGLSAFPGSTVEELTRTFDVAEVLGARIVTLGVTFPAAMLVAPLAEKRDFIVGIQGQPDLSITDPDVISKPGQYDKALSLCRSYRISFDIGDATGGGHDSLAFVKARLDRIAVIYLKDRRKDRASVPWGEGDTPVKEILRLVRDSKYPIRCYIDCDYKTTDRPADVKRSFAYAKAALA
jgi:sugar phosphate isomerase/epimerase